MTRYLCWPLVFATIVILPFAQAGDVPNELTPQEKAEGWKLLFDGKTTVGWHKFKTAPFPAKGWTVEDGWLRGLGRAGGDIISDGQYDEFELRWEWKIAPRGNSGVKYFVTNTRDSALGHEYQMFDEPNSSDPKVARSKQATASFYDVLGPTVTPSVKPPGEVNSSRIIVKGDHVEHWLNGTKVLEYECGSEAVKAAVQASKFKNTAGFGTRLKGHILLQDHGTPVWFRDLKIRVP